MSLKTSFDKISQETWAKILLVISFSYVLVLFLISPGLYGDADSISHYHLARYAFKYPVNFVDHWGKPLYTTLSAPFAQLGYEGAVLFNILCGLLTAWLIFRIAKKLEFQNSLLVIPFSLFTPIYLVTMMTGLTEILFGLVLVASIYFYLCERTIISSVIISFIPYARTEGIMFLFIFLLAFLLVRKYKAIPFLLTGFIIFSLAGYWHYKDLLWFFTAVPYLKEGPDIYGSGSFFYYFRVFDQIMGWPLIIPAFLGIITLSISLFREKKPLFTVPRITVYWLITGSFIAFLLAHSFLWWQGMFGVLSSKRFMACIMPLGGFIALVGVNFIFRLLDKRSWLRTSMVIIIVLLILWMPYFYKQAPASLTGPHLVMKETAGALKKMNTAGHKVIGFDPKLPFYLDTDPFGHDRFSYRLSDDVNPEFNQPDGTYLVWDPHFGGLEKQLSLEEMLRNPHFRLVDGFIPEKDYLFHNKINYMSLIFQKISAGNPQNSWVMIDSVAFESAEKEHHIRVLTDSVAYSGNLSNFLDKEHMYGIPWHTKLDEIAPSAKVIFRFRVKMFFPVELNADKVMAVLEVRDKQDQMIRYLVMPASYFQPPVGKWFELSLLTPLTIDSPEGGYVKAYVWNSGDKKIFIDDQVMEYLPVIW